MSAPILLTKAPKAEGLSRSENAQTTSDAANTRAASFAAVIEKGLNGREKIEQRTLGDIDSESAAGLLRGETAETITGFPFPQGNALRTERDIEVDQGDQAGLPELGPSDNLQHAPPVPDAACGKNSPQPECAEEKPALLWAMRSPPDGAAGGESEAQRTRPYQRLDTGAYKQQINEDSGPTQVDLKGLAQTQPGKGIADATQRSMSEKSAFLESLATTREREYIPMPPNGEQRADARPEIAPAVSRSLQSPGGNTMSPIAPTPTLPSVSGTAWPDGLGNQIRWMLNRQSSVAELKLNPPELGSMEVRIALDKEVTNIQFLVHNVAAKDMVEEALPRLRVLLSDAGVNLQDVGVKERTGSEHQHNAHSGFAESREEAFTEGEGYSREEAGEEFAGPSADATDRIIDAYA